MSKAFTKESDGDDEDDLPDDIADHVAAPFDHKDGGIFPRQPSAQGG